MGNSYGQFTGSVTYDFRDGTIITAGKTVDGALVLSGTYSKHSDTYGLNMKVGGKIKIAVQGTSTVRFLGSIYSSLNIEGKTKNGTALEPSAKATKVAVDLTDVIDFVYRGVTADTLTFTLVSPGSDLYLPKVDVIPSQLGGDVALTTAAKNIIYGFDLRNGSIIPTNTAGNTTLEQGLFKIEPGSSNAYKFNDATHGASIKTGNKITLKVAGNSYIKFGGCQYSSGSAAATSSTGNFDKASQSMASTCYDATGATVDFLYVGAAGTVTFEFTGQNYIPYIQIAPVPYTVELNPWIVKTGTITINGTTIGLTAGANSSANAVVTVSSGTVISATSTIASLRINLSGGTLGNFTPSFTGDISAVTVKNDSLLITYSGVSSIPTSYKMIVADNSIAGIPEDGKTYAYNFADGSVFPQTSYTALRYPLFVTKDNLVTMKSNTATPSGQFGYHDAAHGSVMFPGNSVEISVAGNATINFIVCQYGVAKDGIFEFKDGLGNVLGSCLAKDTTGTDGTVKSFTYTGAKGIVTATLKSTLYPNAEVYIHGLSVENAAKIIATKKTDVWDFGAFALDTALFNNKLDSAAINTWYAKAIVPGSANNVLPTTFTSGVLTWVGGSNDRLRTTNTKLTRYDSNVAGVSDYTGRLYVNSAAATSRYMSLTLSEDDEVTVVTVSDAGGRINFAYTPSPASQTDVVTIPTTLDTLTFVAKAAGNYHIYDNLGKPGYFRIYRKDADYVTINGTVNASAAPGLPAGYGINMKNNAGKIWNAVVSSNTFSIKVPAGYTYSLSLSNASGYVISNGFTLNVTKSTTSYNVAIQKVDLFNVSGKIIGLDTTQIKKIKLVYTSDPAKNKIYIPEPVINYKDSTYSVQLEPKCQYTISATGINDYFIPANTMTIRQADSISNVVFTPKPVYAITIDATGITEAQKAKLKLTFTNLNETGYVYSFNSVTGITLRDGTYSIAYTGIDSIPYQLTLTSNLKVNGAASSKTLAFVPITVWSFDDRTIASGTTAYKGLLFTGAITSQIPQGHLLAKSTNTIQIPVNVGDKITVTYYYTADFTIGGTQYTTASNSTSKFEYAYYTYPGTQPGYVTITVGAGAATTYFPEIAIGGTIEYKSPIYVGADKEYKSVNDALTAIGKMVRPANERVVVMIDPGNYEEMLVVNAPNVTLKNAATAPSIALLNKGVDIDANAVRITSYYGHGYNYYSMKNNQKWDADVLKVNKENGYLSYVNTGSGTTNGSYWNATVVVNGAGFVAEDIIFENSYNQYISKKESEDVVVMWTSGGKGIRPTDIGNTSVQNRSFVERAAAIAINSDKVILNKCRIVGRQDSYYGAQNIRVVNYKGAMMGAVDYLFGGMVAVFYKSDLVMNNSDVAGDATYLTAAQQASGRGYLMYECNVKSATPGTESASVNGSKPGYFGRPWQATTSEVVFYNTNIDASTYPGSEGKSLISPIGWDNSLGGTSAKMYEFGSVEKSGENNQASRAAWSTVLSVATLTDGTAITTFNFTKGSDNWDPIPDLIANDPSVNAPVIPSSVAIKVYPNPATEFVNIQRAASNVVNLSVYDMRGIKVMDKQLISSLETIDVSGLPKGIYVLVINGEKQKILIK